MAKNVLKLSAIAIGITVALAGCGGGGGGGGPIYTNRTSQNSSGSSGSSGTSSSSQTLPYYTPMRVDSVQPINTSSNVYDSSALFSANISSATGQQDLILAGRMSPNGGTYNSFNLQMWSWSNGSLVNKTSQWFSGTDNQIVGTEPSVKFVDFDNDGRKDIYVAPNTDTNVYGPGVVFFNNGTNFTRVNIDLENTNGHDSAVYDLNRDGYADIVTMGLRFSFGGPGRTFTTYWGRGDYPGGGAAVAVADFMANGTSTLIMTDMNNGMTGNNKLYNWNMGVDGVYVTKISDLPDPRFLLPKWGGYGFSGSHDIRALAFDFDNSGKIGAVIFSRPKMADGTWPEYSEVQFNKNMGGGVFVDVTDTVLVGYDTKKPAPYNPVLMDVNGDGLIDIVMGGTGWSGGGAQVLVHTKEQKYVASYGNVLQAFGDQVLDLEKAINSSATNGANGIVFVQGPDNKMYLATAVTFTDNGVQKKAIYLSKLGDNVSTAQATVDSIKQTWPWMSDAQVNQVLASSNQTWLGATILDPNTIWSPSGQLMIYTMAGMKPITGQINGIKIDGMDTKMVAMDSSSRSWRVDLSSMVTNTRFNAFGLNSEHVDQFDLSSHTEYLINANMNNIGALRVGYEERNRGNTINYTDPSIGPTMGPIPKNYSIGMPRIWNSGPWTIGAQYTTLGYHPWLSLSGSWGSITGSSTLDYVLSFRHREWSVRTGIMQTTAQLNKGLVTSVGPVTGFWAEAGYRHNNLGIYAGIKPTVLSGSVEASLPTGVDNRGRIMYSSRKFSLNNEVTTYVRALAQVDLSRNYSMKFGGTIMSNGEYRIMNELRYQY